MPPLFAGDIFLFGHSHIQVLEKNKSEVILCNPGSVSLPKGNLFSGFATFSENSLSLYKLDGKLIQEMKL